MTSAHPDTGLSGSSTNPETEPSASPEKATAAGNTARLFIYRNCFTGDLSGGDMHTVGVCTWLSDMHPELQTTLIYPADDGQDSAYADTGLVQKINYSCPRPGSFGLLYIARALLGIWRVRLPWASATNILVASSHFLPDVLPVACKGRNAPGLTRAVYIHHIIQDMPRIRNFNNRLADWQEKLCFALIRWRFDKIIVVNQAVARRLRELGFHKQQIFISNNFVNTEPDRRLEPYESRDITLIFCGRFMVQKGVDDFLAVCRSLQPQIADFSAVMMGAGPELDRIRAAIASQKLNVQLAGFVTEDEKFAYLRRTKLFVFPSIEEGWGIVVAEALAMGTPVVAYDLPVYREVFGDVPYLVTLGKIKQLTTATRQLLEQYAKHHASYEHKQQQGCALTRHLTRTTVAEADYTFLTR